MQNTKPLRLIRCRGFFVGPPRRKSRCCSHAETYEVGRYRRNPRVPQPLEKICLRIKPLAPAQTEPAGNRTPSNPKPQRKPIGPRTPEVETQPGRRPQPERPGQPRTPPMPMSRSPCPESTYWNWRTATARTGTLGLETRRSHSQARRRPPPGRTTPTARPGRKAAMIPRERLEPMGHCAKHTRTVQADPTQAHSRRQPNARNAGRRQRADEPPAQTPTTATGNRKTRQERT